MNYKYIFFAILIFFIGQAAVWIQTNGPLIWPWATKWRWALILLGSPITWLFMEATRYTVQGFGGVFWPGRFISFVTGITIFALMTWIFRDEAINMKTAVSLLLAFILLMIQLFWK